MIEALGYKVSKRTVAKELRQTAKVIDEHGWIQNAFGDEERGFCVLGAHCHIGGGFPSQVAFTHWLRQSGLIDKKDSIPTFNDAVAQEKKDVTRELRQCARALEHGWEPGKEIP